jgi:hypothetical protein
MISRRRWLKAVGYGAASSLMAPFLYQIASAQADGQAPKRFLIVLEGNGFEPVTMLSDTARTALNASLAQPLEAERWWHRRYRHDAPLSVDGNLTTAPALAALEELAPSAAILMGLSSKIAGGGHSALHGALSSARSAGGSPGGATIDTWLSEQALIRRNTPYAAIRLGVGSDPNRPLDFGTCAYRAGYAAPLILKPEQAFQSLFGFVASEHGADVFAGRGAQLEFAIRDVQSNLGRFAVGSHEREKLERYQNALEGRLELRDRVTAIEEQLRLHQPAIPEAATDPLQRFRQQLDVAVGALMGGLTNVCVVGCGTGDDFDLAYPTIFPSKKRHDLHHESAMTPEYLQVIHEVTRQQVQAIAGVARRLANTPDVLGGTMLDNTVIVYIGDNGEQHHSTASDFPTLLIGGGSLGLRTGGRTLIYPGLTSDGHRQVSNLWNTLGHLGGVELNEFGHESRTRRAPGPLPELIA